jgi:hypothetical protein
MKSIVEDKTADKILDGVNNLLEECWSIARGNPLPDRLYLILDGRRLKKKRVFKKAWKKQLLGIGKKRGKAI